MFGEPLSGFRQATARARRTKKDWAIEIAFWSDKTNAKQRGVDRQFRIENARTKLKRLYPKIKT